MQRVTGNLDSKGAVVIPAKIRRQLGISSGSLVLIEAVDGAVVLRPAVAVPVERYSAERKAEFMLNNAADAAEYREALRAVRDLGLDPDRIPHDKPEAPGDTRPRVR